VVEANGVPPIACLRCDDHGTARGSFVFYQKKKKGGVDEKMVKPSGDRQEDKRTSAGSIKKPERTDAAKSMETYAEQLNDTDSDIREEAISDMTDEYEEAALIYLKKVLVHDSNDDVRAAAAEEIGELESERGIEEDENETE